jgi:hypothetical protein
MFKTLDGLPQLTTNTITNITATTATCGGNITSDGGFEITARGIVWSTLRNPTIDNNKGKTNDGTGIGSFTANLTELTLNTTYYVRAYATNSVGIQYSNQVNFTTLSSYTLDDYLGEYLIQYKEDDDIDYTTDSSVIISSYIKEEGTTSVYIEGLMGGYFFMTAYGRWDKNEKCIILLGGHYDESKTFYFTSEPCIFYYSVFLPVFYEVNSNSFNHIVGRDIDSDSDLGEAKLVMNNDGAISYQGVAPDRKNRTANGFIYDYYSESTGELIGFFGPFWDITLIPLNSPSGIKAYNTKQKAKNNAIKKIRNAVNSIDLPIKQADSPINNTK